MQFGAVSWVVSKMSLCGRSQGFPVRYTVVDFVKEFLKEVFFSILIWSLYKIGRVLVTRSKPYFKECMWVLRLIFHYFAIQIKLESKLQFFIFCLTYIFHQKP